jgi:hypothetical protein
MENLILILLFLTLLLRFLIGVQLFSSSKQNNLPNLRWLAGYFCLNAFNLLFAPHPLNPLGGLPFSLALFILPVVASQGLLILFNQDTFYKDQKSPALWFWVLFALTSLGAMFGIAVSESNFNQSPWVAVYILSQIFIWVWHAWIAYRAWSGLADKVSVQDWVKSRYLLIVAYPLVFVLGSLGSAARIIFAGGSNLSPLGSSMALLTLATQSLSVILQYLVWAMPAGFRAWLNRNYQTRVDEYSHEHTRAILHLLGSAMSQGSGITEFAALRVLRQTIGVLLGTEDSQLIEARILQMGYPEWDALLKNAELVRLLLQYSNTSSINIALENARNTLIKEQSLFTLEAR